MVYASYFTQRPLFVFPSLKKKVIGSDVHTSIYDKRDDFGFPIVKFTRLSGDVSRLSSHGVHISQLLTFANVLYYRYGCHF